MYKWAGRLEKAEAAVCKWQGGRKLYSARRGEGGVL